MLVELKVSNFAIIHQIHVQFGPGLNIISGETGAGKSIIVRALGLLMGAKSQADDVREGLDQSVVEGHFELKTRDDIQKSLKEFGITETDNELLVRRIITRDGKNRVYINGHLSTLADLKNIVAPMVEVTGRTVPLIEVTGQHDNKTLLSPQYHIDLLDQFCQTWDLRRKVHGIYSKIQGLEGEIEQLQSSSRDRSQRIDFIKYQITEIENLNLQPGEDERLEANVKEMKAQSSLAQFYQQSLEALEGNSDSVTALLEKILKSSQSLKFRSENLNKVIELLQSAHVQVIEAGYQLNQISNQNGSDENLEQLEARLSDLRRLQKKFGSSVDEILKAYDEMKSEVTTLEQADETVSRLQLEIKALRTEMQPLLKSLTQKRSQGAQKLIEKINHELSELNMKGVLFTILIEPLEAPTAHGQDQITFAIQNGPKGEVRPLHKSASGGELSRILLSLKLSAGGIDIPRTYLFDEVDTGVSGPTAQKVGKKLKDIARGQQVICITHLPQVASFADQHYFISKKTVKGQMNMVAVHLTGQERAEEIARLISGEKITPTSLAHAKQLLKDSHAH